MDLLSGDMKLERVDAGAPPPLRNYIFARFGTMAILLLVALGTVLGIHHATETRLHLLTRMETRSFVVSQSIDAYLDEHRRAIVMLATLLGEMKDPGMDHLSETLHSFHESFPSFLSVLVADSGGVIISADPVPKPDPHRILGSNISDRPYFQEPLRTGRPFRSEAFRGRGFGHDPIVALSAPVKGRAPGTPAALVEGSLNLQRFRDLERYLMGLEESSMIIVDERDQIVYSSSPAYSALSSVKSHPGLSDAAPPPDVSRYTDERGHAFYVARQNAANGWTVYILQPRRVLVAHVVRQVSITLFWLAVAIAVSVYLSRRVAHGVTLPLEGLVDTVRAVTTGAEGADTGAHATTRSAPLEIQRLLEDFALMRDRLSRSRAQLEIANRDLEESLDLARAGSRTKSAFLATMSHELRTPLNAILGFSGILESRLQSADPRAVELATNIRKAGEEMLALVEQLLEIALFEAGQAKLSPERIDAAEVLGAAVDQWRAAIHEHAAGLTVAIPSDLGEILVDRNRLHRTLRSLLGGIMRIASGEPVRIDAIRETLSDAEWIVVRATLPDRIDRAVVSALLEPFWQGDETAPRRFSEAGLGIAIAHRSAELMGGDLTVSTDAAQATSLVLRIPAAYEMPHAG